MNKHSIAVAAGVLALAGCATQPPAPQVAGEDLNIGIAKSCTASKVDLTSSAPSATIAMTNDGWCAVRLIERDGQPFQLGLLRTRPEHGRVLIQKLGGETRLEYTAENRYVGADRFTVALRPKAQGAADIPVQVAVTVTMGELPPAPPSVVAPPAATRSAPARSSSNRSGSR